MADVLETARFAEGEAIMTEGADADCLYILRAGSVVVKQKTESEDALLRILKPGAYFGERALLADEPRSATVEAVSAAECLRVDKAAFFKLLGPIHGKLGGARRPL